MQLTASKPVLFVTHQFKYWGPRIGVQSIGVRVKCQSNIESASHRVHLFPEGISAEYASLVYR
jgi:hypothetical protein